MFTQMSDQTVAFAKLCRAEEIRAAELSRIAAQAKSHPVRSGIAAAFARHVRRPLSAHFHTQVAAPHRPAH